MSRSGRLFPSFLTIIIALSITLNHRTLPSFFVLSFRAPIGRTVVPTHCPVNGNGNNFLFRNCIHDDDQRPNGFSFSCNWKIGSSFSVSFCNRIRRTSRLWQSASENDDGKDEPNFDEEKRQRAISFSVNMSFFTKIMNQET